jgi:hypothetical protein
MDSTVVWIGIFGSIIAVLCLIYAVYSWERKKFAEERELAYLDELALEHEEGAADNRKKLEWLIRMIENNYSPSSARDARLDRVRRILRHTPEARSP